jgi:electron transfer flavoprotein alpha subunit
MSVLVFIDTAEGKVKKNSLEAICYGADLANQLNTTAEGVVIGKCSDDLTSLGKYGIKKIHQVDAVNDYKLDAASDTNTIAEIASQTGSDILVFSNNTSGKAIAPRLSVKLKAGFVSSAIALPDTSNGFNVKKTVFAGKAFANVSILTSTKIISVSPNSYHVNASEGTAELVSASLNLSARTVNVVSTTHATGEIVLTEAEKVVSGGRGMKGPENWGMLEELAKELNAATACSRPVADAHWRPHHEHVGQTGFAIAPNLYIAVGISGAIQHLAGVNRSKVIVVINKDAEAPFFKAADYGVVGDAFEVIPAFTTALKKLKGA